MALLREQDVEIQCPFILCSKWKKPPMRLTRPLLVSTLSYSLLHYICTFIYTKEATKVMRFRATLYHTVNVFVLRLAGKIPWHGVFFKIFGQIIELIGECSIAIVWMVSLYIYSPSFLRYLLLCLFYFFLSVCLSFFLYFFKTIYYYIDLSSLFEHFIWYIIGDKHCT
jgi:hypothetical protein